MALVTVNHLGARRVIRQRDLAHVFRIQMIGERWRPHQSAEEDRELTAFGGGRCLPWWRRWRVSYLRLAGRDDWREGPYRRGRSARGCVPDFEGGNGLRRRRRRYECDVSDEAIPVAVERLNDGW